MTTFQNTINHASRIESLRIESPLWQTLLSKAVVTVDNYLAQSKRRAIVRSALIAIEARHPEWADIGFDEHFVAHRGSEQMVAYLSAGQLPDPAALADAWSSQFFWNSMPPHEAQQRFMPIAQDFVYILSTASD